MPITHSLLQTLVRSLQHGRQVPVVVLALGLGLLVSCAKGYTPTGDNSGQQDSGVRDTGSPPHTPDSSHPPGNGGDRDSGSSPIPRDQCSDDSQCSFDEVCAILVESGQLHTLCQIPLSEGRQPGQSCQPGTLGCSNGLCPDHGVCSSVCAQPSDCTETGQTCIEILVTLPSGPSSYMGCGTPSDPDNNRCTTESQCDPGEVCAVDRSQSPPILNCASPGPTASPAGTACTAHSDCRSLLCLPYHVCSAPCNNHTDCPSRWTCMPGGAITQGIGQASVCVPEPMPCARDSECPGDKICARAQDGSDLFPGSCITPPAGTLEAGQICDPQQQSGCATGLCHLYGRCTTFCKGTIDCPDESICARLPVGSSHQSQEYRICINPDPTPCYRDGDCGPGLRCNVMLDSDDNVITGCFQENTQGAENGQSCDPSRDAPIHRQCKNDLCLMSGFCSAVCTTFQDCPHEWECGSLQITGGDDATHGTVNACVPRQSLCQTNSDCTSVFPVCIPYANEAGNAIEPLCGPPVGNMITGADCTDHQDCRTGICMPDGSRSYCSQLCQNAASDCPAGYRSCQTVTVTIDDHNQDTMKICMAE